MPIPRKVLIRVVGAPLLLAVLAAIFVWDHRRESHVGLRWLLVLVGVVGVREFYGFCTARGIQTAKSAGSVLMAALFIPWAWVEQRLGMPLGPTERALVWASIMTLLLWVLLKLIFSRGRFTVEGAALTVFGYFYVGLLVMIIAPPVPHPAACAYYFLFLLACSKGSDMAAYVAGKTLGRHKMAPVVSPNKTWEGAIAGGVVGTGVGLAVILLSPLRGAFAPVPVAALLFFALVVTIAAQVGDLVKSVFKRWAGVKDSGRLLPEFGGMLDMVDSFLISIPVAHVVAVNLLALFKRA